MAEPRERYRAVSRLVVGEFAHHLRLCSCVREHIDEVDHDDVEVVLCQLVEACKQFVGTRRVVHLVIRERVAAAVAFYLRAYERFLVEILALVFVLVLVHPQFWEHLLNLLWHQAREDGVACVLRSRRQDAGVHVLLYVEHVSNLLRQHAPLVVAEVVDDDEEHLLAPVYRREYLALEDVRAHQWAFGYARCHPRQVVLLYELGEAVVCFLLLHLQHLGHVAVRRAKLQFPVYQSAVRILPVIYRVAVHYLHRYVLEVLLIARLRHLRHNLLAVYVLLQREQNLVRVDRLDEVVGYLRADSHVHDVLLLAFRHHHYGCGRRQLLYLLQRFESADAGHHLVEQHQVELMLLALFDGICSVAHGHHLVSFALKEDDVGAQEFNLVVYPQ